MSRAIPLLEDNGDPVESARGGTAQTPASFSLDFFAQRGHADAPIYQNFVQIWQAFDGSIADPTGAFAEYQATSGSVRLGLELGLMRTPLSNFAYGVWDAQRPQGIYVDALRDAATIYIGVYGAAAGIPEDMMNEIQNDFAFFRSNFNEPLSTVYPNLPQANVNDLHTGYQLYQTGRIH